MKICRRTLLTAIASLPFVRQARSQDPVNYPAAKMAAEKVVNRLKIEKNPIVVLMIIQIIVSVISILQRWCDEKAEDIPQLAQRVKERKTLLDRRRWRVFRRAVINEIGMEQYRSLGEEKLLNALLDEAIADKDAKLVEKLYREQSANSF